MREIARLLAELHGASLGVFILNYGGETRRVASHDPTPGETEPIFPYSYALPVTARDGSPIGSFLCYSRNSLTARRPDEPLVSALLTAAALADENGRLRAESVALRAVSAENRQFPHEFLQSALHDLRSPFVTVSNMVQLLRARNAGAWSDTSDELLSLTTIAVDRGLLLLSDLSTYLYIGAAAEEASLIELNETVDGAICQLDPLVRECGAVITAGQLPVIRARRDELQQVWVEILQNALTFRSAVPPQVHISAEMEGLQRWRLSVTDNGTGFDGRYANQIFEPFKRLCGRQFPGSGLGLATCKKIIELHGGRIWAESQPGKGSVFRFTLPAGP
ncbi:MAG: ATP-binding protein [Bryobacteraceae bacterium]